MRYSQNFVATSARKWDRAFNDVVVIREVQLEDHRVRILLRHFRVPILLWTWSTWLEQEGSCECVAPCERIKPSTGWNLLCRILLDEVSPSLLACVAPGYSDFQVKGNAFNVVKESSFTRWMGWGGIFNFFFLGLQRGPALLTAAIFNGA